MNISEPKKFKVRMLLQLTFDFLVEKKVGTGTYYAKIDRSESAETIKEMMLATYYKSSNSEETAKKTLSACVFPPNNMGNFERNQWSHNSGSIFSFPLCLYIFS